MNRTHLSRLGTHSSARRAAIIVVLAVLLDVALTAVVHAVREDEATRLPSFQLGPGPVAAVPVVAPIPPELPTSDLPQTYRPASRTPDSEVPEALGLQALRAAEAYRASRRPQDLATAQARLEALLGARDESGLIAHTYPARSLHGEPLANRWYSVDAQALALRAAVMLAATTGERRWERQARQLFLDLLRFRDFARFGRPSPGDPWVAWVDGSGYLWFEEFPGVIEPSRSLTSHTAAVLAVYDYWRLTGSRTAARVFRGGTATVEQHMLDSRNPRSIADNGIPPGIRDVVQHRLLIQQLQALYQATGDETFREWSGYFADDLSNPRFRYFHVVEVHPRPDVDPYAPLPRLYGFPQELEDDQVDRMDPDHLAKFALVALDRYRKNEGDRWLQAAERVVQHILERSVGGMFLHQRRAKGLMGPMTPPWCSAETQGFVLSALVRLAEVTGEQRWRRAADDTFLTLLRTRGDSPAERAGTIDPWTTMIDDNGYVWFERYAQGTAALYIEAQIHGAFAVYDYWRLTKSPAALRLLEGAVATMRRYLPEIRVPGGISRLAMSHEMQDSEAHRSVVRQLADLARLTGDEEIENYAQLMAADA